MTQDIQAREGDLDRTNSEQARRALQAWGDAVKREQLQEALERLETQGRVTREQRRILEEMSAAIVDELLAGVDARLAEDGTRGQVRTEAIVDLFDCGQPPRYTHSTD